ncbi:MAG: hypothetical protein U0401_13320 [Anaerolineae bacterium]
MATSLELAITAIRSGRKEEGRQLLNLLIQQNPNNEMAWLWMSSVVNNDEQRARCLYHVLAINPNNDLAQRGLQLLGIVVSDSRPVRIPRDSQPIPIQKPAPAEPFVPNIFEQGLEQSLAQTQPLAEPTSQPAPVAERRPFRLDPKAITQELPFTPLREPFGDSTRRSPSAFYPRVEASSPAPATPPVAPAVTPTNGTSHPNGVIPTPVEATHTPEAPIMPDDIPLPDFPPVGAPLPSPVAVPPIPEAVPALIAESKPGIEPLQNSSEPTATPAPEVGQLLHMQRALVPLPAQPAAPLPPPVQPSYPAPISIQETRPSQPIWTTQPSQIQPTTNGQNSYGAPGLNGQVTMGMPTQFLQPQPPFQAVPVNHANATMGMPMPSIQPQLDPLAVLHSSATMGVPAFGQMPYQSPYPQNQVYHSIATMAMPTMTEAEARARLLASQGMLPPVDPLAALRAMTNAESQIQTGTKSAKKSTKSKKKIEEEEDEGEEVNLLAVIVFGSLSITALGGLGMLILLWVTST